MSRPVCPAGKRLRGPGLALPGAHLGDRFWPLCRERLTLPAPRAAGLGRCRAQRGGGHCGCQVSVKYLGEGCVSVCECARALVRGVCGYACVCEGVHVCTYQYVRGVSVRVLCVRCVE